MVINVWGIFNPPANQTKYWEEGPNKTGKRSLLKLSDGGCYTPLSTRKSLKSLLSSFVEKKIKYRCQKYSVK